MNITRKLIVVSLLSLIMNQAFADGVQKKWVALVYTDNESTLFLKAVLDSMDLPYRETETTKGAKVEWQSEGQSQEMEIQNRVSQYEFLRTVCKSQSLPPPGRPALKELSCKK